LEVSRAAPSAPDQGYWHQDFARREKILKDIFASVIEDASGIPINTGKISFQMYTNV
jgi:hypothetical protein